MPVGRRLTAVLALVLSSGAIPASAAAPAARHLEGPGGPLVLRPDGSVEVATPSPRSSRLPAPGADFEVECLTGQDLVPTETCRQHAWATRTEGSLGGDQVATATGLAPDGSRLYATGYSPGPESAAGHVPRDLFTVAHDAETGDELWTALFDTPASWEELPAGLAVTGDRVFVAGTGYWGAETRYDYTVVAYDAATGEELWVARYDGPAHLDDQANAIAVEGDTVYLTGWSNGVGTSGDVATVAIEAATGEVRWVGRYDHPHHDVDRGAAVTADGSRVYVTGDTWVRESESPSDVPFDLITAVYDAGTGEELWHAIYAGPNSTWDYGSSIAAGGGRLYVSGTLAGTAVTEAATLAFDAATGEMLWVDRYAGESDGPDTSSGLALHGDRLYLVGTTRRADLSTNILTLAYDGATGSREWEDFYEGPQGGGNLGVDLGVSPAGDLVYVTGLSSGITQCPSGFVCHGYFEDYATYALEAAGGARRWEARYVGEGIGHRTPSVVGVGYLALPPYDAPAGLAVAPDGSRIYVVGSSYWQDSGLDLVPVAYDTG